ncbi:hypothetical protein EDD16DRAFT_1589485 [Pisolithus croceorrhizus]|nr:hypothetical protein EDD16DRAFT_1589485 [Pisolithus croceorrhizus]
MAVSETLLRILVGFPKLFIAIVKRCSWTTLHLLQYIFSFLNASVPGQKSRARKHFAKNNSDNSCSSTTPSNDIEKGREMEAGASVGSATILRSPDRDDGPSPTIPKTDTSGGPAHGEGPRGRMPRTLSCEPPLRKPISLSVLPIWLASLISMLARLDHPGFIWRTLEATQQDTAKPNGDRETNVKQWAVFSDTFQRDIENINLWIFRER